MEAIGSGVASILFPAVQINRNAAWINYMWYNQQRFINYSVGAFGLLCDQLLATSLMAAQNRFIPDQMRAPEEGVYTMIVLECCTVIPLHTSAEGALAKVLAHLQSLQEEHVPNSGFGAQLTLPPWLSWFLSGDWAATLARFGTSILALLLFVGLVACCMVPCTRRLVVSSVTTNNFFSGQYVVMGEELPPQRVVVLDPRRGTMSSESVSDLPDDDVYKAYKPDPEPHPSAPMPAAIPVAWIIGKSHHAAPEVEEAVSRVRAAKGHMKVCRSCLYNLVATWGLSEKNRTYRYQRLLLSPSWRMQG